MYIAVSCITLAILCALFAALLLRSRSGWMPELADLGEADERHETRGTRGEPRHAGVFVRALLANPRAVGACCPSSPRLARAVAAAVDVSGDGLVIELGGGTGAITAALLARGVPRERLVVVERDPRLARHLEKRFGSLKVIGGDASELATLLAQHGLAARGATIVSSLPMISLSGEQVRAIGAQMCAVLPPQGSLVQYTYQLALGHARVPACLELAASHRVWFNLPPARVEVYRHRGC